MLVALDCERMKYPQTGLFEYCYKLGLNLIKTKGEENDICFYMPEKDQHYFGKDAQYVNQKSLHKFLFPRLDPQIYIWHGTHQTSWYMPPASRKVKRVLTIHDLNFLYEEKSASKRSAYLKKHQKNIDLCDHIVAISEFTKADVLKNLKISKPITVIYNGCDVENFPEHTNPVYHPARNFILGLGTINAKKNFHVLPCLLRNNNYELILAGKADLHYQEKIIQEAKKYGVEDRVKIIGTISNQDKYWYYKNCEAFLLPSLAEGFGIPVIEAMNFGKPVFLSNRTSLPEIGGKLAYYFDDFNPENMNKVFENGLVHYEANQPSADIINHAKGFSWEKSAKAYWEVYNGLMK